MAVEIYECFYKNETTNSQMREYFVARIFEADEVPEILILADNR